MRGRPRHSEDETPGGNDEQGTEATAVNIVDELPRTGLVVFDDCVSLVPVNSLPETALNRWRKNGSTSNDNPKNLNRKTAKLSIEAISRRKSTTAQPNPSRPSLHHRVKRLLRRQLRHIRSPG
ncbi:hypothetical protein FOBRF1_010712 [Fusarium oxysporum]